MTILTRNHADLALEVKAHIDADAQERSGLPEPLMRIAESIFGGLPDNEGPAFFAALPDAVGCDGKDLSLAHWAFLASELRTLPQLDIVDTVIAGMDLLAAGEEWSADAASAAYVSASAHAAAAHAASADAAYFNAHAAADAAAAHSASADAAYFPAYAVAHATAAHTAYAANYAAADASARIRQRDTLLRLISGAPMGGETE